MARAAPAASRAVSIISFLTAHSSRGFTITELVHHLGMNIASAHATLAVLQDAGFVLRDPVHRTYVLGPALAATGFAALEQHPAVQAAVEQAELLADELDAEVGVTAVAGRDVIFLARRGPGHLPTAIGYPGDRSPLLAPIGAVFMAWADADAVSAWLERAEVLGAVADQLRRALSEIRARGFSVPLQSIAAPEVMQAMERVRSEPTDEDAEHHLTGVLQQNDEMLLLFDRLSPTEAVRFKTVAAPVFDEIGRVVLSISVTGPDHPVAVEDVLRLGRRVARAAAIATRQGRGRAPAEEEPARVPSRRTG
jgi:DNA-binding IclR family transcriptional regulator